MSKTGIIKLCDFGFARTLGLDLRYDGDDNDDDDDNYLDIFNHINFTYWTVVIIEEEKESKACRINNATLYGQWEWLLSRWS